MKPEPTPAVIIIEAKGNAEQKLQQFLTSCDKFQVISTPLLDRRVYR